jgi:hypothetical protein
MISINGFGDAGREQGAKNQRTTFAQKFYWFTTNSKTIEKLEESSTGTLWKGKEMRGNENDVAYLVAQSICKLSRTKHFIPTS